MFPIIKGKVSGNLNKELLAHTNSIQREARVRTFGVQGLEATEPILRDRIPRREHLMAFYFTLCCI